MQKGFAPIIILVGILVVALIGYVVFVGFPQGKSESVIVCHGIPLGEQCLGFRRIYE